MVRFLSQSMINGSKNISIKAYKNRKERVIMIHTSFIHECDRAYMIESAYNKNMADICAISGTLDVLNQQRTDLQMFGIFTESKEEYYTESVTDAIRTIGQKIMDIIEHFREMIDDLFRKWRENRWSKKDSDQKIRDIAKRDPKAADRVRIALNSGDLDMNTFKDLNDFFTRCDDVLKNIEDKQVDPKSLRGKWNKAKECLERNQKTIAAVGATLGVISTGAGIYYSYKKYKTSQLGILDKENDDIRQRAEYGVKKIKKEIEILENMAAKGDETAASRAVILAEMAAEYEHITTDNINKRMNLKAKVTSLMFNALSKIKKPTKKSGEIIQKIIDEKETEKKRLEGVVDYRKKESGPTRVEISGTVGTYHKKKDD